MPESSYISFRPLEYKDINLLYKWLNKPHIQGTYYPEGLVGRHEVEKKFIPRIEGTDKTKSFILLFKEEPIGYIQTWKLSDFPEYKKNLNLGFDTAVMDLFIGEEKFLGKGLGSDSIKKFVKEISLKIFKLKSCIAAPFEGNKASIKAFEKAGFRYVKTVYNPKGDFNEYILLYKNEINK